MMSSKGDCGENDNRSMIVDQDYFEKMMKFERYKKNAGQVHLGIALNVRNQENIYGCLSISTLWRKYGIK